MSFNNVAFVSVKTMIMKLIMELIIIQVKIKPYIYSEMLI